MSTARSPFERREIDKPPHEHRQLVARVCRVGADAKLFRQPVAVKQSEDGLRVADVDCEQHERGEKLVVAPVNPVPYGRAKTKQAKDAGRADSDDYRLDRGRRIAKVCSRPEGAEIYRSDH